MCRDDTANNTSPTAIGSAAGPTSRFCPIMTHCRLSDANGGPQYRHSYPVLATSQFLADVLASPTP